MQSFSDMAERGKEIMRRSIHWTRMLGYSLYCAWILMTFYCTFAFDLNGNPTECLYLNQVLSLVVLTVTLTVTPLALHHADRLVLSRDFTIVSGVMLAVSQVMLLFADYGTALGLTLIVISALTSGIASGILFLGWGRLYADAGTRVAMAENGMAFVIAGLLAALCCMLPDIIGGVVSVGCAIATAILLRHNAWKRDKRPMPARPHKLHHRTKLLFARGLLASFLFGAIAGSYDILTGFAISAYTPNLDMLFMLAVAFVAAICVAFPLFTKTDYVTWAYRFVVLVMGLGCLLTPIASATSRIPGVMVFGSYISFTILLVVVCIDVSNYFDQPATRTFGLAFTALYAGELTGSAIMATRVAQVAAGGSSLSYVSMIEAGLVLIIALMLFTQSDLTETSLGEMVDEDQEAAETEAAAPVRNEDVAPLLVERFKLTPREADVLPLIIQGRTIARIQEELHISQGTVSTHTRHIYQKTGTQNRQGLLDLIETMTTEAKSVEEN